ALRILIQRPHHAMVVRPAARHGLRRGVAKNEGACWYRTEGIPVPCLLFVAVPSSRLPQESTRSPWAVPKARASARLFGFFLLTYFHFLFLGSTLLRFSPLHRAYGP